MIISIIESLRSNLKRTFGICIAVIILIALWGSFLVDTHHAHTAAEHWPFFWSLFGLVGAIVLIVLARFLGFLGIMTREDYYDD